MCDGDACCGGLAALHQKLLALVTAEFEKSSVEIHTIDIVWGRSLEETMEVPGKRFPSVISLNTRYGGAPE